MLSSTPRKNLSSTLSIVNTGNNVTMFGGASRHQDSLTNNVTFNLAGKNDRGVLVNSEPMVSENPEGFIAGKANLDDKDVTITGGTVIFENSSGRSQD